MTYQFTPVAFTIKANATIIEKHKTINPDKRVLLIVDMPQTDIVMYTFDLCYRVPRAPRI